MHTHHHEYPQVHMPQVPVRRLLEGQTAIVTGASSGIGKAIAIALGTAGANVCVNYVTGPEKAEEVVAEIEKDDSHAFAQPADVSNESDVVRMFEAVRAEFGSVDILINNAGLQSDAPFVDMTRAQWQKVIDVNLTGQFLCAREAVREFRRHGVRPEISCAAGKIICISSVHEVIPWAGHVNYAASKGGVMLMMKSIAQEVAPWRIRVNSIAPGAIRTPINMQAWDTPEHYAELLKLIPYKRIGEAQEIGRAAAWLASDDSDYIHGVTLFVDGGMSSIQDSTPEASINMSTTLPSRESEWLETDGLGGFASGTVSGVRTRRYQGLLVPATMPPAGRTVLVNGFEAWVELSGVTFAISSQRYNPDVLYPNGVDRLSSFRLDPWPIWTFDLSDCLAIEQEFFVVHGSQTVALSWRLAGDSSVPAKLRVRPLLSGRDFHSTHHENSSFQFAAIQKPERVIWHPYQDLPSVEARSNGTYRHDPCWYRSFLYVEEQRRGLDCLEDLASPGVFEWDILTDPAVLMLSAQETNLDHSEQALHFYDSLRYRERSRRYQFSTPQHRTADAYIARRGEGRTIIAGYPWFGDWGRDAFIAIRGLCLATGRLDDARDILVQWFERGFGRNATKSVPRSGRDPGI